MRVWLCVMVLGVSMASACEKKASDQTTAPSTAGAETAAQPQPYETSREALRTAREAARDIEVKGVERNAAADDARNAGK